MNRSVVMFSTDEAGSQIEYSDTDDSDTSETNSESSGDRESLNSDNSYRLSEMTFHNIPAITKLINALYSHTMTPSIIIESKDAKGEKAKVAEKKTR